MLMVGFQGTELAESSHIIRDITEYQLGGVILFDYDVPTETPERNIQNADQVTKLIEDLQNISESPLFVAVDQEGGRVARLKSGRGFPATVSAQYLGTLNNPDSTRYHAHKQASMLYELGFNVNFAPVVDLNTNPDNPIIGKLERSYGADPDLVTNHARIVIDSHFEQRILPVIKHFPGHGSSWNDSHLGMADVTDTWDVVELEPYKNLVSDKSRFGVMTAHVFNKNLDSELPATLSKTVQTDLLRDEIGFDGVLFSDDMQMDAIRSFYGLEFAIKHALLAGVDVLVFANNSVYNPEITPMAISIIKSLIDDEIISEKRIEESYTRIMQAKNSINLVE